MNNVDNLSLILQVLSLQILFQDFNNSDLMNELHTQDEIYLKKIIEQNKRIIDLLERNYNGRETTQKGK